MRCQAKPHPPSAISARPADRRCRRWGSRPHRYPDAVRMHLGNGGLGRAVPPTAGAQAGPHRYRSNNRIVTKAFPQQAVRRAELLGSDPYVMAELIGAAGMAELLGAAGVSGG